MQQPCQPAGLDTLCVEADVLPPSPPHLLNGPAAPHTRTLTDTLALGLPHPLSAAVMNWVGSMVALLGTGLYSLAKQKASDDAKAAAAVSKAA